MIKKILILLIIISCGYVAFIYKFKPELIIPYPYIVTQSNWQQQSNAENANILIVGDRMAKRLDRYVNNISTSVSKNLKTMLSIVNWSEEHEGLHRTIARIKSLKRLPPLIIYHGASEEFYEKRFLTTDKLSIDENFKLYSNDTILSLIMTFPMLSKGIYNSLSYYYLDKTITEDTTKYPDRFKQVQMEMEYLFFQNELKEFVNYLREHGSTLIVITPPLNLEIHPKKICDNSISSTLLKEQENIEILINHGDIKSAYLKANALAKNTKGNAKTYFLMGQILLKLGRYNESRSYLENATAFDCHTWRSNIVLNNIIRKTSETYDLQVLDFDDLINKNIGKDTLFMDQIFPQEIYYEQLIELLKNAIISTLKI